MKKLLLLVVALCLTATLAFAQAPIAGGEPHAEKGDLLVNAGISFGIGHFGVGGGADYIFYKWDIPGFAPLSFGAGGKVGIGFGSGFQIDLAALATMHFGLKTFTMLPPFLQNLDWYWGLGLGFGIGYWDGLGIATGSGICYYLNPTLAISADYFYTGYYGGMSTLGVRLEL